MHVTLRRVDLWVMKSKYLVALTDFFFDTGGKDEEKMSTTSERTHSRDKRRVV